MENLNFALGSLVFWFKIYFKLSTFIKITSASCCSSYHRLSAAAMRCLWPAGNTFFNIIEYFFMNSNHFHRNYKLFLKSFSGYLRKKKRFLNKTFHFQDFKKVTDKKWRKSIPPQRYPWTV